MTFTMATWLLILIPMPLIMLVSLISYLRHLRKK